MVEVNHIDIPLYEPGQRAIICWDGTTELLILSTDVYAEKATKVLEIMPLPSVPQIKQCNESVFERLRNLVEWQSVDQEKSGGGLSSDDGESKYVDIEIVFHDTIGVHDLTVIHAKTVSGFAQFVGDFMENIDLDPMSFPKAEAIASSYMERGIEYFVLDVIEVSTRLGSPQPLMYRFESPYIYYPMEITSLTGGESHIILFVLTPHTIVKGPYEEKEDSLFKETTTTYTDEKYVEIEQPVEFELLTDQRVSLDTFYRESMGWNEQIYDHDMYEIYTFFQEHEAVKIGVYEYDGPVTVEGDIMIRELSTKQVKGAQDVDTKGSNLVYLCALPLLGIALLPVAFILHIRRKDNRKSDAQKKEKK